VPDTAKRHQVRLVAAPGGMRRVGILL
jgi:hypothetical protein